MARNDENFVVLGWGASSADGVTPLPIKMDPTTGNLLCKQVGAGTATGNVATGGRNETIDGNFVPAEKGLRTDTGTATPIQIDTVSTGVMMKAD